MITQQDVPRNYACCFAGKDHCPKANSCLRAIAAKLLAESTESMPSTIHTVNAIYIDRLSNLASCPLYRSNEPLRFAKGMSHLLDEVPLKHARTVRQRIIDCFSCERYFYHSRKGERLISPEEQRKIGKVMQSVGLTSKFDRYEYVMVW